MKIRTSFVSNSSSSSFCIGKNYMTPKQIQEFRDYLDDPENYCDETTIDEGKYYFFGDISMHDDRLREFLFEIGVDMKYVETYLER